MSNPLSSPICPRISVWRPSVVSRDVLHRHGSRRGRVVQRAVRRLAPSRHKIHSAQECQYSTHRSHRKDGDSVLLEETRTLVVARSRIRSRAFELLRTRGIFPAQSRRNKVGVGCGGIRRGEYLNVGIGRV